MSTVVLDTITGKSTATTITIGSTPVVSASANSMTIRGEGSNQTSIQQGLAKMWIQFDGTGTVGTRDSFNRGGLTDNGTGNYTVTYTNNMNNNDFSVTVSMNSEYTDGGRGIYSGVYACNTADCRVSGRRDNANADSDHVCISVHGDLA